MTDGKFLEWIHDRLLYHHGEDYNRDYMHRLRKVRNRLLLEERREEEVILLSRVEAVSYCESRPRTRAEVIEAQSTVVGCCNRHADNQGCDCLERAVHCGMCNDSGYYVHPENGRKRGVRCPYGCPVNCSVCRDPNCDNPGGQH